MKTITFKCRTITPMFLAGADGKTPELRPPSIKGALRFWWRAINPDLAKPKQNNIWGYSTLKEKESKLFGGGGDSASRSSFSIQVKIETETVKIVKELLVPHKQSMKQKAFKANETFFSVVFRFRNLEHIEKIKSLFIVTALLGGLGKRVRRGMGAFAITSIQENNSQATKFVMPQTLGEIKNYLNSINPGKFRESNNKIVISHKGYPKYPFIKSIEIGKAHSGILNKISNTTHELKEKNKTNYEVYEASLGSTSRGRFASPVYVSVLENNIPIITTLNTVPKRDSYKINQNLQQDFKNRIL